VKREPKAIERAAKAAKSNPKYISALKALDAEAQDLAADAEFVNRDRKEFISRIADGRDRCI
jgi:hypothetical protein